jgi:hypothetical protein
MDFIMLGFLALLLYSIAHVWGSSRQIGVGWSFALLLPTIIPGLIALLAKHPTLQYYTTFQQQGEASNYFNSNDTIPI